MVNLTKEFSQICDRIEKESRVSKVNKHATSLINDTFIKECLDLYRHIHELYQSLESIRPKYLLFDITHTGDGISDDERDEVDTHFRLKLKEYSSRLNHLQNYESKRVAAKTHFRFNKAVASTVNKHREGVLLCLNRELKSVSSLLLNIQETRLMRTRDVGDGADELKSRLSAINVKSSKYEIVDHHNDAIESENQFDSLTSEQLQVLESETNEILSNKLNDLAKINKINKSVLEIAQLESELSTHLTLQSENISNLVSDYDVTNIGIVDGNKILKSVKNKKNYSTLIVIYTSVIMGLILLFYDFIN